MLVVCAAVRVWLIAHSEVIAGDGTTYVRMGREMRRGTAGVMRRHDYHPAYPAAMVGAYHLLDGLRLASGRAGWELAGQIVSLTASLTAVAAVWWLAAAAFDRRVAWMAALLFGVGRKWAGVGADVLSDPLAVCLQLWALVLAIAVADRLRSRSRWALAAAVGMGLCAGAGYLVRPEALVVAVLAVLFWGVYCLRERWSRRLTAGAAVSALAAAAACSVPYMITIGGLTKKKALSDIVLRCGPLQGSVVRAGVLGSDGHLLWGSVVHFVAELFEAMHPVVGVLACVWLVALLARKAGARGLPGSAVRIPRRGYALLAPAVTAAFAVMLIGLHANVGYLSERHAMFPGAVLAPLAGAGVIVIAEALAALARKLGWTPTRGMIASIFALATGAAMVGFHTLRPLHEDKVYFRRAAEFISEQAGADGRILVDDAWLAHYSRVPCHVVLPTDGGRILGRHLRRLILKHSPTHLALSDKKTIGLPRGVDDPGADPKLKALLASPGIVRIRVFEGSGANPVRVYRVDHVPAAAANRDASGRQARAEAPGEGR